MKSYFLKIAALFIVSVSISLAAVPCNNAIIKGHYALLAYGTQSNEPFNAVSTITFDGKGNYTESGSWVVNGVWNVFDSVGGYSVGNDCRVAIYGELLYATPTSGSVTESSTQQGVLAAGGKKIFAVRREDGKNLSFIYEKQ